MVLGIIIGYFCFLLGLGIFGSRLLKLTSGDYFLASRGIGPFMLLMSIFGTTMTAFALVGSTGGPSNRALAFTDRWLRGLALFIPLCSFSSGQRSGP